MQLEQFLIAVLGSNALTAFLTNWLNRRRDGADVTHVHVQTALALEERAIDRYGHALEALETAQDALNQAREELEYHARYIVVLRRILDAAGLKYPEMDQPIREEEVLA